MRKAMTSLLDHVLSPDFDNEQLVRFAIPFCRLMFAYASVDREIVKLVCAATGNPEHEDEFRRGSVETLSQDMVKFINRKGGDISRTEAIEKQIDCAKDAYQLRNDLAHGEWWKLDPETSSVSVRRDRAKGTRFIEITVGDIEQALDTFKNVEAELFKIRRQLEKKR
jgi:hypothetical protein